MNNPLIPMSAFVLCFRKQFLFQNGRGGYRKGKYYTAYNKERGLKTDKAAIMVFIFVAPQYGFEDKEIVSELGIKARMFYTLKEEVPKLVSNSCPDTNLHITLLNKIALVRNSVMNEFRISC